MEVTSYNTGWFGQFLWNGQKINGNAILGTHKVPGCFLCGISHCCKTWDIFCGKSIFFLKLQKFEIEFKRICKHHQIFEHGSSRWQGFLSQFCDFCFWKVIKTLKFEFSHNWVFLGKLCPLHFSPSFLKSYIFWSLEKIFLRIS